jgi:hypothetical protein
MPTETRPTTTEVNCETGEVIIRPMTDAEYASYLVVQSQDQIDDE